MRECVRPEIINAKNVPIDRDIPASGNVARIPDAAPLSAGGTLDTIAAVFGDVKRLRLRMGTRGEIGATRRAGYSSLSSSFLSSSFVSSLSSPPPSSSLSCLRACVTSIVAQ